MKITIKTIKGEVFPIEVEPANKISEVKQKLQEEKGLDATAQKLILRGKNADDNQSLEELGVKEGDFMVVMVSKKPATQAQPQAQPAAPTQPAEQKPEPAAENKPATESQGQSQGGQAGAPDAGSGFLFGETLNKTISDICDMGFEREQVVKAMKAAYNNPDRAIEYLFSGIPEQPEAPAGGQGGLGGQGAGLGGQGGLGGLGAGVGAGAGAGAGGAPDAATVLAGLAQDPNFQQLRAAVRNNPQMLQSILSVIAQNNPQLFQLITQNQEAFTKLLLEGDDGPGGAPGGGPQVIQVTAEEKAAIDRLCSLGFDRGLVIEAYFACDKDEALAANYLLERQMDDLGGDVGASGSHQGEDYDDDNLFNS